MKNTAAYRILLYFSISVSILATCLGYASDNSNKSQTKNQASKVSNTDFEQVMTTPAKQKAQPTVAQPKSTETKKVDEITLLVKQAESHFNAKEYDKATTLLWKKIDKLDRYAIMLLIRAHEKRNEAAEIIRAANLLTAKDDKDYEAYHYLAVAAAMKKNKADTLENFKKAIEINPKFQPAYEGLIKYYENNLYELRLIYQDMLTAIGRRTEFLTHLCTINVEDIQADQAEPYCKEAIQKNPQIADNFVNLGKIAKLKEDSETSAKLLKNAAIKFPKSDFAQYEYAKFLEEKKNYTEAMKYYEFCTKANDKADQCWSGLGTTSAQAEKFDVSYTAYKNACRFNRKYSVAVRRSIGIMQNAKAKEWLTKFEDLASHCAHL